MTKLEALPFDPERWEELSKQGWLISIDDYDGDYFYVGVTNYDVIVIEQNKSLYQVPFDRAKMLPPPVVIEFKVGLFKYGLQFCLGDFTQIEASFNFIRWLTPNELAKGEVRVEG